jgi:CO dehydrogenase/acetyl-CoA synthase delta subunit
MIDVNHHRDFNLCMRLRELIIEARVMDPTFSILPLGGEWWGDDHKTGIMAKHKGGNRQVLFPLESPKQCCWENENCYCTINDSTEEPVR